MQINIIPNLPQSGAWEKINAAMEVFFFCYLVAYFIIKAVIKSVSRVVVDLMTNYTFLTTYIVSDKGSHFTSAVTHGRDFEARSNKAPAKTWHNGTPLHRITITYLTTTFSAKAESLATSIFLRDHHLAELLNKKIDWIAKLVTKRWRKMREPPKRWNDDQRKYFISITANMMWTKIWRLIWNALHPSQLRRSQSKGT